MTTLGVTGFTLGSLNLRTIAQNITSPNGWDVYPGFKDSAIQYAYTHGQYVGGRKFYRSRSIDLHMVLLATDSSGQVTTSPEEHLQDNIDTLLRELNSSLGTTTLRRTMPDGSERSATVRPIDVMTFDEGPAVASRSVVLVLEMGYPFWGGEEVDQTSSGTFILPNGGTAPVNDMIITFDTAGRITHNLTGEYLESAVAGLKVFVETGDIINGTDNDLIASHPWWMQLEPGDNSMTVTGGNKTFEYRYGYF